MPDTTLKPSNSQIAKATNLIPNKSKGFNLFKRSSSSKSSPPIYQPPPLGIRDDLVTKDLGDADASHPSDHNLHLEKPDLSQIQSDLISRELASKDRVRTIKKDLERVASKATTGTDASSGTEEATVDEWRKLQAERKEGRTDHVEAFTQKDSLNGEYYSYWGVSMHVPKG